MIRSIFVLLVFTTMTFLLIIPLNPNIPSAWWQVKTIVEDFDIWVLSPEEQRDDLIKKYAALEQSSIDEDLSKGIQIPYERYWRVYSLTNNFITT